MYSTYSCIALGLLSTVAALPAFGRSRLMFYREAASGLNRCPCLPVEYLDIEFTCTVRFCVFHKSSLGVGAARAENKCFHTRRAICSGP